MAQAESWVITGWHHRRIRRGTARAPRSVGREFWSSTAHCTKTMTWLVDILFGSILYDGKKVFENIRRHTARHFVDEVQVVFAPRVCHQIFFAQINYHSRYCSLWVVLHIHTVMQRRDVGAWCLMTASILALTGMPMT